MQNADAECIADANCIAELPTADQEANRSGLKRLARQRRWAGFNRSRAFRQAWDLGSRALGEGAFSEDT